MAKTIQIYSWNVNGIRSAHQKGFLEWLHARPRPSIVGLQETRAEREQLSEDLESPDGWLSHFVSAQKKGYSGVGVYTSAKPNDVVTSLGRPEFDDEGRAILTRFGELDIWNVYFPNGSGKNRDLSRIPYKLDFYAHLLESLKPQIDSGGRVLVMGDFNTALSEIDLARPKGNEKTSGFRPEEREALQLWLDAGFVDTFRHQHPDAEGHYTWWSQRKGVRERNVGWRIDYILASPAAHAYVESAQIHADVMGSDHCPISVSVKPEIAGDFNWSF
ncbi:exodeoxyribonuclease III [Microvenator marinus]|uniref:exodeoxyribonuclease III n=1 Tax=Microvenator marinus TaxID=2600177 RepID=UPI00201B643C|nr:exodeoxyribonuclease III [Microvenator marinus]